MDRNQTEFSMLVKTSRGARFAKAAGIAVLAFTLVWTAGCGGSGSGGTSALYKLSVNRLKAADLGVLMYMNDYDDVLPVGSSWMDAVFPYTKTEVDFHSPAVTASSYGYALNSAIQGQEFRLFSTPSSTISLFDTTDLSRNATATLSTEPSPPRYENRNTIAYLDGHVKDENTVNDVSLYSQSQSHLKQVDLGMLMYSNDWDSSLPLANQWDDELTPYIKSDVPFHSPAVYLKNPADYGYAFNIAIAGQTTIGIAAPANTISFFDSTVLTKNATASTTTLPNPPRYGKNNTIAYADGHVQQ